MSVFVQKGWTDLKTENGFESAAQGDLVRNTKISVFQPN